MAYAPLPQFQYPQNALLDFTPVNQGINALSSMWQNNRKVDQWETGLQSAARMPGMRPEMMDLARSLGPEHGPNALFQVYNATQQRAAAQAYQEAQMAHNQAVLAETSRHHRELTSDARRRTDMLDERVRARYGIGADGQPIDAGQPDITQTHGMDENGVLVPLRPVPNIGPRMSGEPPMAPDGRRGPPLPPPRGPMGLYGDAASGNVQDATSAASRRMIHGPSSMGTPDTKDDPYLRSGRAGISDPRSNAIIDAHPDRERLAKYQETQRMWGSLRGRPPQGFDYRDDGSLNNLKEGTSIKEMKADKEIPTWLQHLEVSRKVLENASGVERGVAEAWNAIPGLRQLNPMTSTIEAKDLAAHAVQQLVNATRAANHANKVDERHLQWFVPSPSDPPDLVKFKLSQAQNIFSTYMSARAKGTASEDLSNLIAKGVKASEETSVFQRYRRITGEKGNANLEQSMSKNVEVDPRSAASVGGRGEPRPEIGEARAAIAKGANRGAVIKRLREMGIDPGGL